MAHQEAQVLTASAADIAADMAYHRESYARFINISKWTGIVAAVLVVIVFFVLY